MNSAAYPSGKVIWTGKGACYCSGTSLPKSVCGYSISLPVRERVVEKSCFPFVGFLLGFLTPVSRFIVAVPSYMLFSLSSWCLALCQQVVEAISILLVSILRGILFPISQFVVDVDRSVLAILLWGRPYVLLASQFVVEEPCSCLVGLFLRHFASRSSVCCPDILLLLRQFVDEVSCHSLVSLLFRYSAPYPSVCVIYFA